MHERLGCMGGQDIRHPAGNLGGLPTSKRGFCVPALAPMLPFILEAALSNQAPYEEEDVCVLPGTARVFDASARCCARSRREAASREAMCFAASLSDCPKKLSLPFVKGQNGAPIETAETGPSLQRAARRCARARDPVPHALSFGQNTLPWPATPSLTLVHLCDCRERLSSVPFLLRLDQHGARQNTATCRMPGKKARIDSALNNVVTILVQNKDDQSVLCGLDCSEFDGNSGPGTVLDALLNSKGLNSKGMFMRIAKLQKNENLMTTRILYYCERLRRTGQRRIAQKS